MKERYGLFEVVMHTPRKGEMDNFEDNPQGRNNFVAGGPNWWVREVRHPEWTNSNDMLIKLNGGSAHVNYKLLDALTGGNAQYCQWTEKIGRVRWYDLGGYGDETLMQGIDDHVKYERRSVTERAVQYRNAQVVNWIESNWGRVQFTSEEMAKWQAR